MDKKYIITLDKTTQKIKPPTKDDYGIISNNLTQVFQLTSEEITNYAAPPYSYTFSPGIFSGSRSNANWTQQQVFMLDFDSGVKPQQVFDKLTEYEIIPNIIYYTIRHTEENPRFRVVLLVEEPIYDYSVADFIRKGLIQGIPESDASCSDAARFFLGGVSSQELNKNSNEIDNLINFSSINLITSDNGKTRKLSKKGLYYNINYSMTSFSPDNSINDDYNARRKYLLKQKTNHFDFETAKKNLKIIEAFSNGKDLKYKELFGLVTNLIYCKGGEKFLKNTMSFYNSQGVTNYKDIDFALITTVKFYGYLPQRLEKFSVYEEDHRYFDVYDAVKKPRGDVKIIKATTKIQLCEAEKILDFEFNKAIESNDQYIHIISTETGIGKSSKLTRLTNTTLAFPTHNLKNEISQKMAVEHFIVPDLPKFSDNFINEQIKNMFDIGLNTDVYILLKKIADFSTTEYSVEDKKLATEYLALIKESYDTPNTVLTTHLRALYDQYSHNTIIFDEDPINNLLAIKKFDLSDLLSLESLADENNAITQLINFIRGISPGAVTKTNFYGIDIDTIVALVSEYHTKTNIIQFFTSKALYKDKKDPNTIHYLIQRDIPMGKKVIILSATPQIEIYKALYGERVKVIDIPLAESQGKITQHVKNGFSRSYLKNNPVEKLVDKVGGRSVITFMKYKHLFPSANPDLHYGNCTGYDFLKGQNIAVIGTPHKNEILYLFTAYAMGIDLNQINLKIKDLKISWKGFSFRFSTYEDQRMMNIQLGAIESELVQAIGRSRSLRTDATVLVYSNLPLQISTIIEP
jgi:hypothetical protein